MDAPGNVGPGYYKAGKILEHDSAIATGAGHNSVIHNKKSDKSYMAYYRKPLGEIAATTV